jgi:hypothetical protein
VRDPELIKAEVLSIMASPTPEQMTAQMRQFAESAPDDELAYAQEFMERCRNAAERTFRS